MAFDILNFAVPHVFIWRFMLPFVGREFCFSAAAARFIFSFVVWVVFDRDSCLGFIWSSGYLYRIFFYSLSVLEWVFSKVI